MDSPFEKYLPGETAPSLEKLRELVSLALDLQKAEVWDRFADQQLIVTSNRFNGDPVYANIMGMMGEYFAIHCLLGEAGYDIFRRIQDQRLQGAADMYSRARQVEIEWTDSKRLEQPDRDLYAALGHKAGKTMQLKIRSARPGYWPWLPDAAEVDLAIDSLRAVQAAHRSLPDSVWRYWDEPRCYVKADPVEGKPGEYAWKRFRAQEPTPKAAAPAPPDRAGIDNALAAGYPRAGAIDIDHTWVAVRIGEANRRRHLAQLALAIDQDSGFAYTPEMQGPGMTVAENMQHSLLRAIREAKRIPLVVRVRGPENRAYMSTLSQELGFRTEFSYSLPELDMALRMLMQTFE